MLLPGSDMEVAESIGQRMRETAARLTHPVASNASVTISVGIAALDSTCASYDELLARADRALYVAKSLGRDRVTVYDSITDAVDA